VRSVKRNFTPFEIELTKELQTEILFVLQLSFLGLVTTLNAITSF